MRDSVSNVASSNNKEDGEDEEGDEEDTELGKLSKNDESGWVLGITSKTVKQGLEIVQQRVLNLD